MACFVVRMSSGSSTTSGEAPRVLSELTPSHSGLVLDQFNPRARAHEHCSIDNLRGYGSGCYLKERHDVYVV